MSAALRELQQQYRIDPKDVLLLDGEPWLNSQQLSAIARQEGGFSSIDVDFKEFVRDLNQVVWRATLVSKDERIYSRSGVATIGEPLPTGGKANVHDLAASRALRSALAMAGYDVLKSGAAAPLKAAAQIEMVADVRLSQLRQIHALAEECGLIQAGRPGSGRDDSAYRAFLQESFSRDSVAGMTESERAMVINALTLRKQEFESL